jgi:carbon-monoxide dehydrogenase catalytic subunit
MDAIYENYTVTEDGRALLKKAEELVKAAVENFSRRNKNRVAIPAVQPQQVVSGLSVDAVIDALGATAGPLIDAIKAGKIRAAVGVVGCNNPKI